MRALVSTSNNYDKCDKRVSLGRSCPVVVAPKIVFERWERSASGVRFYYTVIVDSKDVTSLNLTSLALRKATLLGTSEKPYVYNQKLLTLRFEKPIKAGLCREFACAPENNACELLPCVISRSYDVG